MVRLKFSDRQIGGSKIQKVVSLRQKMFPALSEMPGLIMGTSAGQVGSVELQLSPKEKEKSFWF